MPEKDLLEKLQQMIVDVSIESNKTQQLLEYMNQTMRDNDARQAAAVDRVSQEIRINSVRQDKAVEQNREDIEEVDEKLEHLHDCMHASDLSRTRENAEMRVWIGDQLDELTAYNKQQELRRDLALHNQLWNLITGRPKVATALLVVVLIVGGYASTHDALSLIGLGGDQ
jgi:hypothetical protein